MYKIKENIKIKSEGIEELVSLYILSIVFYII